ARQPGRGRRDLGGRGGAEQGRERGRLGRAGPGGPNSRGRRDDLSEQHRLILASTTDNAPRTAPLAHADRAARSGLAGACGPRGSTPAAAGAPPASTTD